MIYLTDHLLDSAGAKNSSSHKFWFYHEYRKYLFGLLLLICVTGLVMVIVTLSSESIIAGLIVIGFVFLYLTGQHFLSGGLRKYFPKEFIISVIYIAAIWIIPLLQTGTIDVRYQPYMALHFLLVLANVSLFSLFERSEDLNSHKSSLFGSLPTKHFKVLIITMATFVLAGAITLLMYSMYTALPFIVISVIYLLEAVFSHRPFLARYYAEITDGVFLLFLFFFLPNFSV